jgi:hypothetical protein
VGSSPSASRHGSCIDLSLCRLTVIHTHFWEAIEARLKLVEFRSPRQIIPFFPGMHLLFSLIASERRKGRNELLAAHVLEIVILSRAEAYARFPREAEACNLTGFPARGRSMQFDRLS